MYVLLSQLINVSIRVSGPWSFSYKHYWSTDSAFFCRTEVDVIVNSWEFMNFSSPLVFSLHHSFSKFFAITQTFLLNTTVVSAWKTTRPVFAFCEHMCSSVWVHMHACLWNHALDSRHTSKRAQRERRGDSCKDLACCDSAPCEFRLGQWWLGIVRWTMSRVTAARAFEQSSLQVWGRK